MKTKTETNIAYDLQVVAYEAAHGLAHPLMSKAGKEKLRKRLTRECRAWLKVHHEEVI